MSENESFKPYKRPSYGTKGRKAVFRINYFEVKKSPKDAKWLKYAVEIKKAFVGTEGGSDTRANTRQEPRPLKIEIKRKAFKELEKKKGKELFQNVAYFFDGEKTLYTNKSINMKTNFFTSSVLLDDEQDLKGRPGEYMVQIIAIQDPLELDTLDTYLQAKTFRWDFFNMDSVTALNDLMHTSPSCKYFQSKDLILDPNTRKSLGGGMELWAGFFESVRPGQKSFFVNVNRTHSVFYEKKDLVKFLCEFLGLRDLPQTFTEDQKKRINKVLTGLKVRPLHRPNIKCKQSIGRISPRKAIEHTFTLRDSEKTTNVKEYFKDTYNIVLKYPHVMEIQSRNTEVWPLECCELVEGQRVQLKNLNGDQLANMIKFTAVLPKINMEIILNQGVDHVLDFVHDPKLRDFGIEVDTQMAVTPGRILDPPTITYHSSSKDGAKLNPNKMNGAWNLRGRRFFESGAALKSWFVLCCIDENILPRQDGRNTDKNGNCVPGTIIDQKITHPYLFDFYLYSHSSLQGTSRPAHCVVLYDENKFAPDTLQSFTYKLCYNYQRATRSVSIPPPVYYAHLSAKHARTHVTEERDGAFRLRPVLPLLEREYPMYFM
ncbi:9743_t:CDS:2 [Ambispora leptoticha]|uniref:9743_t:CDS:1 n=1 Tax=Ambispora leptoticha TaxID=144679 RepID=A0A9N9B9A2_9GLOM|nr:9743_t:CDS:2 [Ambispora leptoticha]